MTRPPFALRPPDGTIRLGDIISISDAADAIGAHPSGLYAAAKRLGVPLPKLGRTRFVERLHLAALASEIGRRSIETRRPAT